MTIDLAIQAHARRFPGQEVCGLIRQSPRALVVQECENTHPDPVRHFRIDHEVTANAMRARDLLAYYHSHPFGPAECSEHDKANAKAADLPLYVYSLEDDQLAAYAPRVAPLMGRPFLPLVNDCVSLLWDFLADGGIELPPLLRRQVDYSEGITSDWLPAVKLANAEFKPVSAGPGPERGDILLMTLGVTHRPNHVGISLGENRFIHQRFPHPSGVDIWGGYWKKHTTLRLFVPGAADILDKLNL